MLKKITINTETVEMMVFLWTSIKEREKLVDSFFVSVADKPAMQPLYADDFSPDSVRKVLSAMTNRELLNNASKKESRFWSNNMWMTEDMDNMNAMLQPVKQLNLDYLLADYQGDTPYESIEIYVIPGHLDTIYQQDNKLYINFFKIMPDFSTGEMKIEGQTFKDYVEAQVRACLA